MTRFTRHHHLHRIAAAGLVLLGVTAAAADTIRSDFESGSDEGWTFTGDVDVSGVVPGGPVGSTMYLEVTDAGLGPTILAWAPAAFLGDWTAFDGTGAFSADIALLAVVGGNPSTIPVRFEISGPGGTARHVFTLPPIGPWINYRVPINDLDWQVTAGTWAGLITDVTSFNVNAEFGPGFDTVGLDNITLSNDYEIAWFTIDGGGGLSLGADLALQGTIGQPDAGTHLGGTFELRGGFWDVPDEVICLGDTDGSGGVDIVDLLGLLGAWNSTDPTYDFAPAGGDGVVDIQDLLALLAAWGPCP